MLTAKVGDEDVIMGLTLGADDYITKPFKSMEVLARIKTQLRRYTQLGGSTAEPNKFVNGGLMLDDQSKEVCADGEPVSLTPTEYDILKFFMRNPGKVYSSAQIYESVWNETGVGSEGAVAVHIRHLREKIEINPSDPRYIKVVWGQGYKFEKTGRG